MTEENADAGIESDRDDDPRRQRLCQSPRPIGRRSSTLDQRHKLSPAWFAVGEHGAATGSKARSCCPNQEIGNAGFLDLPGRRQEVQIAQASSQDALPADPGSIPGQMGPTRGLPYGSAKLFGGARADGSRNRSRKQSQTCSGTGDACSTCAPQKAWVEVHLKRRITNGASQAFLGFPGTSPPMKSATIPTWWPLDRQRARNPCAPSGGGRAADGITPLL